MAQHPVPSEIADWVALVVEDNADDLLRYFRRRVSDPEDAADLLGQTLLRLWERAAKVPTTDEQARMWCFGIARNVLREHRRGAAQRIGLAEELRAHLRLLPARDNAADTAVLGAFRAQEVASALATLDERSRELVTLIHWDGFSTAQAARVLGMNESTARTRYSRALHRLAPLLGDEATAAASGASSVRGAGAPAGAAGA